MTCECGCGGAVNIQRSGEPYRFVKGHNGRLPPHKLVDRFREQVHKTDRCWIWMGGKAVGGYGKFHIGGGQRVLAHRFAYEMAAGPIPKGLSVCHHCDNPPCVNPAHLFVGTRADNNLDKVRKGRNVAPSGDRHFSKTQPHRVARGDRHGRTTKPWATPRGEKHGNAKLSEVDVAAIRVRHRNGESPKSLGEEFGVASTYVTAIANGRARKRRAADVVAELKRMGAPLT